MTPPSGHATDDPVDPDVRTVPDDPTSAAEIGTDVKADGGGLSMDIVNLLRGFCMGAADTVPGVSGGTVALILGHYRRLIEAVSCVDQRFIKLVMSLRLVEAWGHIDGRFLASIGAGIGIGIVTLAGVMHWMLEHHLPQTFAVFFGLIVASIVIVRRYIRRWTAGAYLGCAIGIVMAIVVGRLSPTDGGDSLGYLFLSASVAICAMILPGISGAFILLLLGVYHPITGLIKDAAKGDIDLQAVLQMGVFATGCLFGLLAFSKLLRWLIHHHRCLTMATLIGLMIGSVEKLWPLQVPTPETAALKMKERVMRIIPPQEFDGSLTLLVLLAVAAAALVLVLDHFAPKDLVSDDDSGG
jgi:putative membrane protein